MALSGESSPPRALSNRHPQPHRTGGRGFLSRADTFPSLRRSGGRAQERPVPRPARPTPRAPREPQFHRTLARLPPPTPLSSPSISVILCPNTAARTARRWCKQTGANYSNDLNKITINTANCSMSWMEAAHRAHGLAGGFVYTAWTTCICQVSQGSWAHQSILCTGDAQTPPETGFRHAQASLPTQPGTDATAEHVLKPGVLASTHLGSTRSCSYKAGAGCSMFRGAKDPDKRKSAPPRALGYYS